MGFWGLEVLLCVTLLSGDTELVRVEKTKKLWKLQLCGTVNDISGQIKQVESF